MSKIEFVSAPSRVDSLLLLWQEYQDRMRRKEKFGSGFLSHAAGTTTGMTTFDELALRSDIWLAKAVDSIVESLTKEEKAVIYHKFCGNRYLYDSTGFSYVDTLYQAKKKIEQAAKRKLIW